MATTRKSSGSRVKAGSSQKAKAAQKRPASKASAKSGAAARAKAGPARTAKPAKKPMPVKAKASKPVAAKSKTPVKGAAAKPSGPRPLSKTALAAKELAARLAAAKAAPKPPPRLVVATPEASAAKHAAKVKPGRSSGRGDAGVRPLGVLPPEAMAKTKERPVPRAMPAARPAPPRAGVIKPAPPKKGDDRLNDDDLKYFEQKLLGERARILKEMGHLESTVLKVNPRDSAGDLSGYSFHMADAGTDAMEREKAFLFASAEGRLLMEINEALGRLYRGEYGICEMSGKPISRARLEALPWARLSLDMQQQLEKEERQRRGGASGPGGPGGTA